MAMNSLGGMGKHTTVPYRPRPVDSLRKKGRDKLGPLVLKSQLSNADEFSLVKSYKD